MNEPAENKYSSIYHAQPDAVILVDSETKKLLDANDAAFNLYGYDIDEFLSLKFTDISLRPEELARKIESREENQGPAFLMQYHQKKDGTLFYAAIAGNCFDFCGCRACCVSVREVDEPGRSREKTCQNKDLLDLIVNGFNGFIYTVSNDYKVEFMNDALIDHIGYNATGEHCYQLIHGLDEQCPWCVGDKVFSGKTASFEYKCPKNNRWYYYVSTPRLDENGQVTAQQLISIDIHERKRHEFRLMENTDNLKKEIRLLRSAAITRYGLDNIVGQSREMQNIYNLILDIASSDASVLISGESGTGKELVAHAIHNMGKRKEKPFLPINCGGIPDTLIESEFFGYRKGAFTGAGTDMPGFLEKAEGGSIFLDEIAEINLGMQVKLLRAIDGDGYTPIGSNQLVKPDIRIISAANRDPDKLVKDGHMRSDFFFRINVVPIHLPPLRDRRDDIPLLIYHFLRKFSPGAVIPRIPPEALDKLERYDWPGNVRELENIIHRYVILNRLDIFDSLGQQNRWDTRLKPVESLTGRENSSLRQQVEQYEKEVITHCLKQNQWQKGRVASILGINRKTLYHKINHYQITPF
jgi:two-component system, NtrC family, response regulator AtoC